MRYLGIYLTTDCNTKMMEEHLWNKALVYTQALQSTPMTRHEAGILYWSCFLPALSYPLPAVWLPDKFYDKIHWLSTTTILNKLGYHRNLPRCLVFAPGSVGGVGLCHLMTGFKPKRQCKQHVYTDEMIQNKIMMKSEWATQPKRQRQ